MIRKKAFAKLNLALHIIPKRLKNGYFPVKQINCQIGLYDEIIFERSNKIKFICDHHEVPQNGDNFIIKAAKLLNHYLKKSGVGIKITLKKNIPVKAGLGGGSADAALTLRELMRIWKVKLQEIQLKKIIEKIGKDVFYCLKGGVCEVEGDGSLVKQLINVVLPKIWLVIINPKEKKPSTQFMYQHLEEKKIGRNLDKFYKLKQAIKTQEREEIFKNLFNDFEDLAIKSFPIVSKIKTELIEAKAKQSLLAGSGLAVVGFFESKTMAQKAFDSLKNKYKDIFLTYTL